MDKEMWYIYTMEYYAAEKNNDIMKFAGKWMELENVILSEASATVILGQRSFLTQREQGQFSHTYTFRASSTVLPSYGVGATLLSAAASEGHQQNHSEEEHMDECEVGGYDDFFHKENESNLTHSDCRILREDMLGAQQKGSYTHKYSNKSGMLGMKDYLPNGKDEKPVITSRKPGIG
ncbi:hypothetical protein STEG23_009705, partial [Scotinomys teguina]